MCIDVGGIKYYKSFNSNNNNSDTIYCWDNIVFTFSKIQALY